MVVEGCASMTWGLADSRHKQCNNSSFSILRALHRKVAVCSTTCKTASATASSCIWPIDARLSDHSRDSKGMTCVPAQAQASKCCRVVISLCSSRVTCIPAECSAWRTAAPFLASSAPRWPTAAAQSSASSPRHPALRMPAIRPPHTPLGGCSTALQSLCSNNNESLKKLCSPKTCLWWTQLELLAVQQTHMIATHCHQPECSAWSCTFRHL